MTDDLIAWLPAQLDEDEQAAQQLDHMPACGFSGGCDCLLAERLRRALAEVAADRAILAAYEEAEAYYRANPNAPAGELHGLLTAIKHRATVFDVRPGYRDEWRP